MIFGSKKEAGLASQISKSVEPTLSRVRTVHGVPTGFWDDGYVLGYMMGQINAFMAVFGGDGFSIAEKGRVVVECFAALSGKKGKPISEMSMLFAHKQDPDFLRANQNGMFIAMYQSNRIPDADSNPAIAESRQTLAAQGGDPSVDDIAHHLATSVWVDEVKARLSIGA